MLNFMNTSQRRFMLAQPMAWLAGVHLALPAAVTGVLAMLVLSSLQGDSFYDQRHLAWLSFICTGLMVLLLLARSSIHARNMVLSRQQTLQWFASLGGVMVLLVGQVPVAQAIDCLLLGQSERSLYWLDATEMVLVVSVGLSFAFGFAAMIVAYAHGGGPRWTASFAVAAPLVVMVSATTATGAVLGDVEPGLWLSGLVLGVPVILAWRGLPVQLGSLTLSARDLTVMSTGPLLATLLVAGLYVGDEYLEALPGLRGDRAWLVVFVSILAIATVCWTTMVGRLRPVRMASTRE